jgi:hypothetical protein
VVVVNGEEDVLGLELIGGQVDPARQESIRHRRPFLYQKDTNKGRGGAPSQ